MWWSARTGRRRRNGFSEPSRVRCSSICWNGCPSCHGRRESVPQSRKRLLHGRKTGRIHDRSQALNQALVLVAGGGGHCRVEVADLELLQGRAVEDSLAVAGHVLEVLLGPHAGG